MSIDCLWSPCPSLQIQDGQQATLRSAVSDTVGCDCSVGKGEVNSNGQGSIKFTFADDGSTATVQPGTEGKLNVEAVVMPYGLQCAGVYTVTSGEILGVVAPESATNKPKTGPPTVAVIAGGVVGGLVFIGAIVAVTVAVKRRKRAGGAQFQKLDEDGCLIEQTTGDILPLQSPFQD